MHPDCADAYQNLAVAQRHAGRECFIGKHTPNLDEKGAAKEA